MTGNKAPQAAACEQPSSWTTIAVRNFHITVFAISAILGAYLVYASSFPSPKDGEPAPLWPYAGVLLAFLLVGATVNISIYMDKHKMENPLVWLIMCNVVLGVLHLFVGVGYGSHYSWGLEEVHSYPSIWLCYFVVGASANAVILAAFMPVQSDKSDTTTNGCG
ncbi:hypothetical protein LTR56_011085 [Elasticomyces elasticus]|nr:hypothetical protein LTR56_011085 [Elasticomyces elasticus]KAK3662492.1 hypothetical protein LTR22_006773 [Elasticomyces elasticus]KAK4926481.1 hypothetical protein LTR49_006690 [Elasticomyces elasticus]KAK5761145.1 hypothetical protein LTS12_008624 [Elasticomyces elasticus]